MNLHDHKKIPQYIRHYVELGTHRVVSMYFWDAKEWVRAKKKIEAGENWKKVLKKSGLPLNRENCDTCRGSGRIMKPQFDRNTKLFITETEYCIHCGGRGYI